ncbi:MULTISPECIES: SDR family oxidoreductase [unclassified Kitasatospora]|uniref:SDR family oxidoreductase n=1 Tax=unclassified Kitasatospora TaxID=2633591 RepID=UPI001ADFC35C|nr:SDR family oxidoreductase [Kitasatospora sp. RG8]MBP0452921.1 SDR family oxidoreductase [Kitasatospora sp. RG8]
MTEGRIAVVTGASSGIGRAVTGDLVRRGVHVVAAGRRADRLAALAGELADGPGRVAPFAGDITAPGHTEELLAAAEREWGPASLFVASAGLGLPGTVLGSDPSRWEELIEANYLAVLRQLRACAAEFRKHAEADGGAAVRDLVVIGSTVGRQVSAANPVYGSTKFAVHSLVEALRQEVCTYNIRVTLIEPGFVRSGFQAAAGYDSAWFEAVAEENGPLLTPEDVADVIGFAISRPTHVHLDDIRLRPTRQRA